MTWIDWLIVVALNGSVIAYGFFLARGAKTSQDLSLIHISEPTRRH